MRIEGVDPTQDDSEEDLLGFRNVGYFEPTHDPNDFLSEDHENISQQMYNARNVRMNDFESGVEDSETVRLQKKNYKNFVFCQTLVNFSYSVKIFSSLTRYEGLLWTCNWPGSLLHPI